MPKLLMLLLFCLLLTACGKIPGLPAAQVNTGPTPTPLPTTTATEYPTVADRTCQVGTVEPLRSAKLPQGDLMAWAPDSLKLAYVAPALNSNWYLGLLKLVSGPGFNTSLTLSPDSPTYGSLSWSPDSRLIGFISLRLSDDVYTAMTVPVPVDASPAAPASTPAATAPSSSANTGTPPTDWLPGQAAHTDTLSSLKTVDSWPAGDSLRVISSCGEDCDQAIDINLTTGAASTYGEQTRRNSARFNLTMNQHTYDEKVYPVMIQPNWSPDNNKVVYFDSDDRVWVLIEDQKVHFVLETGLGIPRETKWSYDSRYLAVRTDNLIYIFNTECQ